MTGTGPHSGDADNPPRFDLNLRLIGAALGPGAGVLRVAGGADPRAAAGRLPRAAQRSAWVLGGLTVAQGVIGYTQYFTGLPSVLVGLHMLGASLLVVAMTPCLLALRERDPEERPR